MDTRPRPFSIDPRKQANQVQVIVLHRIQIADVVEIGVKDSPVMLTRTNQNRRPSMQDEVVRIRLG